MFKQNSPTNTASAQEELHRHPSRVVPLGCENLPPAPTYPGPQTRAWTGEDGVTYIQVPPTPTAREAARNARTTATYAAECARATTGALRAQYLAQARHFRRAARDLRQGRRSPARSAHAARERLDGRRSPSRGLRARTRTAEVLQAKARRPSASHRSQGARQHRAGPRSRASAARRGATGNHSGGGDDPASPAPRAAGGAVVRAGGPGSSPPPFQCPQSPPRPEDHQRPRRASSEQPEVAP